MFARKQRSYDKIPPTRAALVQHSKQAAYQAGCIWSQSTLRQMELEIPGEWGWQQQDNCWQILWTTLPPIAESCQQLTKCGCQTECRRRCKCYKFTLPCTELCSCKCEDKVFTSINNAQHKRMNHQAYICLSKTNRNASL